MVIPFHAIFGALYCILKGITQVVFSAEINELATLVQVGFRPV